MIENSKISEIIEIIAKGSNPEQILLFGSYARGMANEDSDIDLLIIKESDKTRFERSIEIQKLLIGTKVPIDILVFTHDEFESEKKNRYSFIHTAFQGAQLVYERKH